MTGKAYGLMMTREAAEGNRAAVCRRQFCGKRCRELFLRKIASAAFLFES